MANVYRAIRQLERQFPGTDWKEPPDDRKSYSDMLLYPKPQIPHQEGSDITIARIIDTWGSDGKFIQRRIEYLR
jgi:hypothetical protein